MKIHRCVCMYTYIYICIYRNNLASTKSNDGKQKRKKKTKAHTRARSPWANIGRAGVKLGASSCEAVPIAEDAAWRARAPSATPR